MNAIRPKILKCLIEREEPMHGFNPSLFVSFRG